jgi:hypothetical protein
MMARRKPRPTELHTVARIRISATLIERTPEAIDQRQRALVNALFAGCGSLNRAWHLSYGSRHSPSLKSLLRSEDFRGLFREGLDAGKRLPPALEDRIKRAVYPPADPFADDPPRWKTEDIACLLNP